MVNKILQRAAVILNTDVNEISFVLSNSGVYRAKEAYKNVLLIYVNETPKLVAKWCDNADWLEHEAVILTELSIAGVPAPKFVSIEPLNDTVVLFEQHLGGSNLQELLNRKMLSQSEALKHASAAFDVLLSKTRKASTLQALNQELDELLQPLTKQQVLGTAGTDIANKLQKSISEFFAEDRAVDTSIAHFDFRLANIILANQHPFLFDFEFAHRSHFAACDWFRLLSYSPGIEAGAFLRSECPAALRRAMKNPDLIAQLQTLTYLCEFKIKNQVFPKYTQQSLINELVGQLSSQLDQSQRPLRLQVQATRIENTKTTENTTASNDVDELQKHLLSLEVALHSARQERNESLQELGIARHRLNRTEEQLRVRNSEISHRDQVINALSTCASFRIGKAITGIFKLIPGVKSRSQFPNQQ